MRVRVGERSGREMEGARCGGASRDEAEGRWGGSGIVDEGAAGRWQRRKSAGMQRRVRCSESKLDLVEQ